MPNATQPKRGKALPATNLSSCQKRGGRCAKRSLECRLEQENHSQKVCNANQIFQLYQGIDISTKKRSTKMPLCLAFGTGEGLLWYGICVPCSKRLPVVRDASSEAFGVKNRLLRYGRDIRCTKQGSCGTRRIFKGPQNSRLHRLWTAYCRTGRIFSARNGPRSDVSRNKKRFISSE